MDYLARRRRGWHATRFLLNGLHEPIRSVAEVIYGKLPLGVIDPGLVHRRRDPTLEHSGRNIARVDFWLYEF
jgi:hypothetical protein